MKFLIIGGDLRITKLVDLLEYEGHEIKTFALSNSPIHSIEHITNVKNESFDAVIGPIPFTKDGENLNAPFFEKKIPIDKLLTFLEKQTLIAGPISNTLKEKMKVLNIKVIDIMECEELVIYNTIATAEGTIQIAITNTEKNLHESQILILGFGRVAKTLAFKLKGLAEQVTCAARKNKDFAWIDTLGFNIENINNLEHNLENYDIIINTVPQIIIKEENLKHIKKDALIIDLASKPGGVDQKAIEKTNVKYIWALALPRKSSSSFICKIYKTSNL